jgi:uncharacterized protein YjdB
MPTSLGSLKPLVTVNGSSQLYNTVTYPVGGNVSTQVSASFVAQWTTGTVLIQVMYMISGVIVPGMSIAGLGIPAGATIVGPLSQYGTGRGYTGTYTLTLATTGPYNTAVTPPSGFAGSVLSGTSSPASYPQGPNGIVGPVPGFNCVNILDVRNYYNIPYPPATPLASPPVIGIISFGGGIYGQPITTGDKAGFWSCSDVPGVRGSPTQILVVPINGAINAPNADDGGATLENTVAVTTVNAFYGMNDPRYGAPVYTAPIIILYIAPSNDISEMYRTFYTVLNNPVVVNGKSYSPTIVSCSWGAPEICWTQKMPFPPNPSIPIDNSPNPEGISQLNQINNLLSEASKNGINICCASGDIPLNTINGSVNTYNYAQSLLLQGSGGNGYPTGLVAQTQDSVFPLTDAERQSLPAPQVIFPASSPYVTCVGGSALYFPDINSGAYTNPAEFAWTRANGGISSVFSIPPYQQELPSSASVSAAQFLGNSLDTTVLSTSALGLPAPSLDPISGAYTAPNTAVSLSNQLNLAVYNSSLSAFNDAQNALQSAQTVGANSELTNTLIQTVKEASTSLATATTNLNLSNTAYNAAEELVVVTQGVSNLLVNAGTIFGGAAASPTAAYNTQQALLTATFNAQKAAYTQLVTPSTTNANALQTANQAVQAATAASQNSALAAITLPEAVASATDVANRAVARAAAAVVAPTFSTHPYLEGLPITSPIVPKSNNAYDTAQTASANLPYDDTALYAPSYLTTSLGLGYTIINSTVSGDNAGTIRNDLLNAINAADNLVTGLVNFLPYKDSSGITINYLGNPLNNTSVTAKLTDKTIVSALGQLATTGPYALAVARWQSRASVLETIPLAGMAFTASAFTQVAIALARSGAINISSYASGAGDATMPGFRLPCGLASAATSALAAIYPVTISERAADALAGYPFGSVDTEGGSDGSGNYNGITPALINLRNIYANATLLSRRMKTANRAAHDASDAFFEWSDANSNVNTLQLEATTLYNLIPPASNERILAMDAKLTAAKATLSSASYKLAITDNYAVTTARLAQQSASSTSVWMGNKIATTYDQLGNIFPVARTDSSGYQGSNSANCPLIALFDSSGSSRNALVAAQALSQAAANDKYINTTITTLNTHGISGLDSSGIQTISINGLRLLVQDTQYAAAGAAAQVANVAYSDAAECVARFTDWRNISLVANAANAASVAVYLALTDSSGGSMGTDASGNSHLIAAVNAMNRTVTLLNAATTPYNQQATASATIATNDVVVLVAKLENAINVCIAAQNAIQLAASTYNTSPTGTNISGTPNGQGGTIFTVNMAYAKVTVDAAQAACTAAAILAREQTVIVARRANYSAIALQKLVGYGVIGGAIAGFLDPSGNLVTQTGFGPDASGNQFPLPFTLGVSGIVVNGYKPPSVVAKTVLYQGQGGLNFNSTMNSLGDLQSISNTQPSIITNLAYTSSQYSSMYSAVAGFVNNAQAVVDALNTDSSSNIVQSASFNKYLTNPNVNAVNALNSTLGALDSSGNPTLALLAVQASLISAYEAQQWVVASANASFVNFGFQPANTELISFTPSLLGVVTKLTYDADSCLATVLNAEGAILYAMSKRPNQVRLHDVDASNFACVINANQSAADSYLELTNAAIQHEANTLLTFHLADLTNALSPLAANATTAAKQAAALGGTAYTDVPPITNYYASISLQNANFPQGVWESSGIRGFNLANPNPGPYNGTSTGPQPFPALNSPATGRIQSPAATVLQVSSQIIHGLLSSYALATAMTGSNTAESSTAFNNLLVSLSSPTPSLVDAATSASSLTLTAANYVNYATSLTNQGLLNTPYVSQTAILLNEQFGDILAARQSASANLQATSPSDARYVSRQNMLHLWNLAVDAAKEAIQAAADAPDNYDIATGADASGNRVDSSGNFISKVNMFDSLGNRLGPSDPANIGPASIGDPTIMGRTNSFNTIGSNNAPIWTPGGTNDTMVIYGPNNTVRSLPTNSVLSILNAAVRNAYNATTGAPNANGFYTYVQFYWPLGQTSTLVTNVPENVNDTLQAYNNSVSALTATSAVGNALIAAVQAAALRILAAYQAAVATVAAPPALPVDSSGVSLLPTNATADLSSFPTGGYGKAQAAAAFAVAYWNSAVTQVNTMLYKDGSGNYPNLTGAAALTNLFQLQAIVGLNFTDVLPSDASSQSISAANLANTRQSQMLAQWANRIAASWSGYTPTGGNSLSSPTGALAAGYGSYTGTDYLAGRGLASGTYTNNLGVTVIAPSNWSAYYWTKAVSNTGTAAYQTAYNAWEAIQTALSYYLNQSSVLDINAANASVAKAKSLYAIKIALQSAATASFAAQESANASAALALAHNSYEDLAAATATQAAYVSTSKLKMCRCVPDIAMHANADDLPVIYKLNGGNVYVGGTSIASAMFAGFLAVVDSHSPINYFVNPILYDNYTFPSPLFNDISGSSQVWYPGSIGGATVPPRIANVLPGLQNPTSGLGSGLYNPNVGLGSIQGMNLSALMEVPHLVTAVYPNVTNSASVTVYPGTSATITAYVEPVNAYNANLEWSCSSFNATVTQTNGPILSNNGNNDSNPYTKYDPLQHDSSGNPLAVTPSVGNYALGSIGSISLGVNPWHKDSSYPNGYPCLIFTATVTGVTAVPDSQALPVITVSSTDGSNVYGNFSVIVLPSIQVTGVSISLFNQTNNPSNTILFLGKTLQLVANVTPITATNQQVYWWSSNTSIVNVDVNGFLTALAPGQATIKATTLNNNISASISVYVPTSITGLSVLPSSITLNPNMNVFPLMNLTTITAQVQPPNADYKNLKWELISSTQIQPAPVGITSVISIPSNGNILSRNSNGDILDNSQATITAISNGSAVIKVSNTGDTQSVYGTYSSFITVNVVTPITNIVMTQRNIIVTLNPTTTTNPSLPESYQVTVTLFPTYPSNMNVFWSSSNPKVAVVSNNTPPVLNTVFSDPNFGLWQITETVTPLTNGTTVITVTSADGQKSDTTTVVVTTPVSGLSMSALPVVMNPTRTYALQAVVLPSTATNNAVIWSSTNTSVANVNSNGVVTAITSGSCGITATTVDGGFSAISNITVVTPLVGVQLVINTPQPIHIGDSVQILVVMVPTTATNQLFTWTVTNGPNGAIFTTGPPQNGNIVFLDAFNAGTSVFTVTTADGNKQASINLNVLAY